MAVASVGEFCHRGSLTVSEILDTFQQFSCSRRREECVNLQNRLRNAVSKQYLIHTNIKNQNHQ